MFHRQRDASKVALVALVALMRESGMTLLDTQWCTPRMLGGTDGSHHSATLAQLVRKGLAEQSNRGGHTRNVWQYRRTPAGKKAVHG